MSIFAPKLSIPVFSLKGIINLFKSVWIYLFGLALLAFSTELSGVHNINFLVCISGLILLGYSLFCFRKYSHILPQQNRLILFLSCLFLTMFFCLPLTPINLGDTWYLIYQINEIEVPLLEIHLPEIFPGWTTSVQQNPPAWIYILEYSEKYPNILQLVLAILISLVPTYIIPHRETLIQMGKPILTSHSFQKGGR